MFKKKKKEKDTPVKPEAIKPTTEKEFAAAIIDAMIDGITVTDMEGRIIYINRATTEQLGYKKDEVIGKTPAEVFMAEKDVPKFFEEVRKLLSGEPITVSEYLGRRKDGKEFPGRLSLSVLKDAQGKPTAIIAVHRDITELKRAEEEQVRSISAITEAMADGLILTDMDGIIISANTAAEKIMGLKKSEIVGKDASGLAKIVKPEDMEKVIRSIEACLEGKLPVTTATGIIAKDGKEIPVLYSGSFIKDEEGKPTTIVITFKDITELKRLQEEAAKTKEATILEAMIDGVAVIDMNGNIIQCNTACAKMYGHKFADELFGKNPIGLVPKREITKFTESIKECMEKGFVRNIESIGMRKDGSEFPIQLNTTILKDETGKLVGMIGTIRDITEIKKTREELQAKLKELEDFHDVAVGTELEMAKLEEEVERLKKELEKKG